MKPNEEEDFGFDEKTELAWRFYLKHFSENVFPIFAEHNVSFDAALTCWFVNRLRNAIPDDDVGNEPWRGNV